MGRPLVALMDEYPEMPSRMVWVPASGRIEEAEPTLSVRGDSVGSWKSMDSPR